MPKDRTPREAASCSARLDQVLTSLLANALTYSPDGGEVRVRVHRRGEAAEIAVGDRGMGIPAEEQGARFRPFAPGEANRRQVAGAGLGLYISRQIVERHGGMIAVESAPGAGSTFTVRLLLAPPR